MSTNDSVRNASILLLLHQNCAAGQAAVAKWFVFLKANQKVRGSNLVSAICDFSTLTVCYPQLGVLRDHWGKWNHTAEFDPYNGCTVDDHAE